MRLGAPSSYVDVFVNGKIHIGCQKHIRERAFYQNQRNCTIILKKEQITQDVLWKQTGIITGVTRKCNKA